MGQAWDSMGQHGTRVNNICFSIPMSGTRKMRAQPCNLTLTLCHLHYHIDARDLAHVQGSHHCRKKFDREALRHMLRLCDS